MTLPCGCNPLKRVYCPAAADLITRNAALLTAAITAQEIADDETTERAWALFIERNAEYLRHARGETA
jgi:hypothetical protein